MRAVMGEFDVVPLGFADSALALRKFSYDELNMLFGGFCMKDYITVYGRHTENGVRFCRTSEGTKAPSRGKYRLSTLLNATLQMNEPTRNLY